MDLVELITSNPVWSASIASAVAGTAAFFKWFFKPIMRALQTALVRRIEQAWPDGKDGRSTRESVVAPGASEEEVVDSIVAHVQKSDWMTRTLPSVVIRNGVRKKHNSDRPPKGD